ncbi:glycosyltransferase [Polaribacter sp. PL03]|uniref:glycosyltransferase n=1 Tax=Polaribacter sp. PL03 TaxID=3088353 RepID=UPI0029D27FDD|nr:glycosyltransferase [Polaribacter sp. PL03]MDX6746008.1 glycosyltransferase [Polaribacter sp. PL03]
MKKGIIVLFSEDERKINKNQFINLFNQKDIKICFVNNGSKDNTLHILKSVKEDIETNSISILDIKKNTSTIAAVNAGVRYLYSSGDLNCIMYFKSNMLTYFKDKKKQFEILNKIEKKFENPLFDIKTRRNNKNVYSYKDLLNL